VNGTSAHDSSCGDAAKLLRERAPASGAAGAHQRASQLTARLADQSVVPCQGSNNPTARVLQMYRGDGMYN